MSHGDDKRRTRLSLSALAAIAACWAAPAHAQAPSQREELDAAVLPLPTSLRGEAGVFRRIGVDRVEIVRPSHNGMSCLVDDPADDEFDVRCYHDEFWPVIRRFGELRRSGASFEGANEAIRREAESGELSMPATPTAGYRMLGPITAYDFASRTVGTEIKRWQSIHFPFRTAEEMGLTEEREPSKADLPGQMPYVMTSGTWWAHVMIVHEPFD